MNSIIYNFLRKGGYEMVVIRKKNPVNLMYMMAKVSKDSCCGGRA